MIYQIYIGANNDTKQLEKQTIEFLTGRYFDGFTMIETTGHWKGQEEPSAIVQIETKDRSRVIALALELKTKLNQDAVGLQELPSLQFLS